MLGIVAMILQTRTDASIIYASIEIPTYSNTPPESFYEQAHIYTNEILVLSTQIMHETLST